MRSEISKIQVAFCLLVCLSFVAVTNGELNAQGKAGPIQKQQTRAKHPTQRVQPPLPKLPGLEVDEDPLSVTAEQLLEHIDTPVFNRRSSFFGAKLSDEEKDKAAMLLRKRYPFVSLRDRLGKHAAAPESNNRQEVAGSPSATSFTRAEPPRVKALRELHSNEVRDFISRPGAGFSRSIGPMNSSPYDLREPSSYAVRMRNKPIDSDLRAEDAIELESLVKLKPDSTWQEMMKAQISLSESGMPTKEMASLFHKTTSGFFAGNFSNGLVNSVDQVAGFQSHRVQIGAGWNESIMMASRDRIERFFKDEGDQMPVEVDWKLNRMQLVSLLLHDGPQVYISENLPNMEELSGADVETRDLDAFELDALKRMRDDENVITRATPNRVMMMGSLRATQDCMKCHAVKENELLGAFTYEFLRDPKLDVNPIDL